MLPTGGAGPRAEIQTMNLTVPCYSSEKSKRRTIAPVLCSRICTHEFYRLPVFPTAPGLKISNFRRREKD
jgi:hypothetical protein